MAKHSSHILELARKGAEHKYQELKAELAQLVKHFPDLSRYTGGGGARGTSSTVRRGRAATAAANADGDKAPTRKRRKLSAKARKAISDAQKKRWAAQKAGAAAAAEPTPRKAARKRA
jgi:hypothetical protein